MRHDTSPIGSPKLNWSRHGGPTNRAATRDPCLDQPIRSRVRARDLRGVGTADDQMAIAKRSRDVESSRFDHLYGEGRGLATARDTLYGHASLFAVAPNVSLPPSTSFAASENEPSDQSAPTPAPASPPPTSTPCTTMPRSLSTQSALCCWAKAPLSARDAVTDKGVGPVPNGPCLPPFRYATWSTTHFKFNKRFLW